MKPLTQRQHEIQVRRALGQSLVVIAYDLKISDQTVKNHITRMYNNLGVETLPDAFRRIGWLRVPGVEEAEAAA